MVFIGVLQSGEGKHEFPEPACGLRGAPMNGNFETEYMRPCSCTKKVITVVRECQSHMYEAPFLIQLL